MINMTANPYRPDKVPCPACGKTKHMDKPCTHCGYNKPMEDGLPGLPNLF